MSRFRKSVKKCDCPFSDILRYEIGVEFDRVKRRAILSYKKAHLKLGSLLLYTNDNLSRAMTFLCKQLHCLERWE